MSNFKLVSNVLNEAHGEFPDIDEYMLKDQRVTKRFLFWTKKVAVKYDIDSAIFNKKDTDLCRQKFKNLNVLIYQIPDKTISCSTVPGFFGDMSKDGLTKPANQRSLHKDYRSLKMMKFENAKVGPNGLVIFPSNQLKAISIFPTYGLLALATPEERLAVYLHEIGHWNYLSKMIPRQILYNDEEFSQTAKKIDESGQSVIIPFYNIQLMNYALKLGYSRWNEYESDLYAARLGYGKHLKSLFDKIIIGPPKNLVDAYTYMEHQKTKQLINSWNNLKSRLNLGHPSLKHRKDHLDYAEKNKKYYQ